jgi:hypothetical protein
MKVNISNYTQSVNNAHWVVKTDASCGRRVKSNGINEGGYEIASFVASGIEDIEKISKVAHNLKRSGVRANNNCGYHIHINASDFNEEEMGQLISYWLLIEDVFFNMVPFRRTVNRYCKKVKIKNNNYKNAMSVIKNSMKIWEMYRPKTINIRNPTEKRYSLNLLNYFVASKTKFKRKTIEFRFPEGTLCQETINICGFGDGKSLCILDHDLIKTKIWVLKRLIRFSKVHEYKNQAKKLLTRIYRGYGNAKTF